MTQAKNESAKCQIINNSCGKELREVPENIGTAILFQLNEFVAEGGTPSCKWKRLRGGLCQLMLPFKGDAYRALYSVEEGGQVLLLSVFKKKTDGEATRFIETAQQRLKSWGTGKA